MRDRANINTNIWTDQDWRDVPKSAKYLYLLLLTHPTLNYAGVVDWRPARIAAMSPDDTADSVRSDAEALQEARFVFVDDDTEEILIRSFLRHDGLLKQPKLSISMVNAFGSIASKPIRQIVTHEIQRLHSEFPTWAAFGQEKVLALTKLEGKDMHEFTLSFTPRVRDEVSPSLTLLGGQAYPLPTSTATTTSTEEPKGSSPDEKREKESKLSKNWAPTAEHIQYAKEHHVDVMEQAENFRLHAETHDRRAVRWNAAFTTWLKKSKPSESQSSIVPAAYAWANR